MWQLQVRLCPSSINVRPAPSLPRRLQEGTGRPPRCWHSGMYSVQNSSALVGAGRGLLRRRTRAHAVSRTVLLLGMVSLLTDISSEMVAAVLPLYLVYTLGFTPLAFGVIDGVYQGAS